MDGGDAAGIVFPGHILEPGFLHHGCQALLVREGLDGARQVHEALAVARDQAAPEGDEVLEVEAVQRAPYGVRRR